MHLALTHHSLGTISFTRCKVLDGLDIQQVPLVHKPAKVQNKALIVQNSAIMAKCLSAAAATTTEMDCSLSYRQHKIQ